MTSRLRTLACVLSCLAGACDDAGSASDAGVAADGGSAPAQCAVEAPTTCPSPAPSYADVEPVFAEHCVPCHDGRTGGPWPLKDYWHIADWKAEIRGQVLACTMPPADAGSAISDAERGKILSWILCGAPP